MRLTSSAYGRVAWGNWQAVERGRRIWRASSYFVDYIFLSASPSDVRLAIAMRPRPISQDLDDHESSPVLVSIEQGMKAVTSKLTSKRCCMSSALLGLHGSPSDSYSAVRQPSCLATDTQAGTDDGDIARYRWTDRWRRPFKVLLLQAELQAWKVSGPCDLSDVGSCVWGDVRSPGNLATDS